MNSSPSNEDTNLPVVSATARPRIQPRRADAKGQVLQETSVPNEPEIHDAHRSGSSEGIPAPHFLSAAHSSSSDSIESIPVNNALNRTEAPTTAPHETDGDPTELLQDCVEGGNPETVGPFAGTGLEALAEDNGPAAMLEKQAAELSEYLDQRLQALRLGEIEIGAREREIEARFADWRMLLEAKQKELEERDKDIHLALTEWRVRKAAAEAEASDIDYRRQEFETLQAKQEAELAALREKLALQEQQLAAEREALSVAEDRLHSSQQREEERLRAQRQSWQAQVELERQQHEAAVRQLAKHRESLERRDQHLREEEAERLREVTEAEARKQEAEAKATALEREIARLQRELSNAKVSTKDIRPSDEEGRRLRSLKKEILSLLEVVLEHRLVIERSVSGQGRTTNRIDDAHPSKPISRRARRNDREDQIEDLLLETQRRLDQIERMLD